MLVRYLTTARFSIYLQYIYVYIIQLYVYDVYTWAPKSFVKDVRCHMQPVFILTLEVNGRPGGLVID